MTLAFRPEAVVLRRVDGHECKAVLRLLQKGEERLVLSLQDEVFQHGQDANLYFPLSVEEAAMMMEEQGVTMGVFVGERLIAFYAVFFPYADAGNLGRDVGLSPEALMRVAHFEAVCVHPHFRGNGLQKGLIRRLIRHLRATPYDLLFQTVSPFNLPSLKNCLPTGFVICALKRKYGGEWRYILFRHRDVPFQLSESESHITVPLTDFAVQQKAFAEGYVGAEIFIEDHQQHCLVLVKAGITSFINY